MNRLAACASFFLAAVVAGILIPASSAAVQTNLKLRVRPRAAAGTDVPVGVTVTLPKDLAGAAAEEIRVTLRPEGRTGADTPGQIVRDDGATQLWWILPTTEPGKEQTWIASLSKGKSNAKETFVFEDTPGDHLDLLFGPRRVTRYMYAFDTSTPERQAATWKVYHHVFDEKGENVITQGAGGKLYPHHRGIFFGGKVTFGDGKRADWWHREVQAHQKFLDMTAGPVLARSTALVNWKTSQGQTVLIEKRRTTAYRQSGDTMLLLDFHSCLESAEGDVSLGGDREHGGVQFRTHGDVDPKETRYRFPAEDTDVRKALDLPWAAMSMVLNRPGRQRYSIEHMNHPDNPKQTEYSAYRPYGRFGAFFRKDIPAGRTLCVQYRIWVRPGDLPSRRTLQERRAAFAEPPTVEVVE